MHLLFYEGHLLAVPLVYVPEGCYKINNPNPLQTQAPKVPHLGTFAVRPEASSFSTL